MASSEQAKKMPSSSAAVASPQLCSSTSPSRLIEASLSGSCSAAASLDVDVETDPFGLIVRGDDLHDNVRYVKQRASLYRKCIAKTREDEADMEDVVCAPDVKIQDQLDPARRAVAEILIDARTRFQTVAGARDKQSSFAQARSIPASKAAAASSRSKKRGGDGVGSATKKKKVDMHSIMEDLHRKICSVTDVASQQRPDHVAQTEQKLMEQKRQQDSQVSSLLTKSDMLYVARPSPSGSVAAMPPDDQLYPLSRKALALLENGDYDGMSFDDILHQLLNPADKLTEDQVQEVIRHVQAESKIHMRVVGAPGTLSGQFEFVRSKSAWNNSKLHDRYTFLKKDF
jgi:hypothetical protein